MSLSLSDVARLAQLARLHLDQAEAARSLAELNAVLELIEQLQAIDTAGVEPMTHAGDKTSGTTSGLRRRDDQVTEADHRDDYQSVAPAVRDGLYLVPRVLE